MIKFTSTLNKPPTNQLLAYVDEKLSAFREIDTSSKKEIKLKILVS